MKSILSFSLPFLKPGAKHLFVCLLPSSFLDSILDKAIWTVDSMREILQLVCDARGKSLNQILTVHSRTKKMGEDFDAARILKLIIKKKKSISIF